MLKKSILLLAALTFMMLPMAASAKTPVKIGSKAFTEQVLLGKIMVHLLKDRGIPVDDKTSLGGTKVNREALEQGQIDLYMEYTGTAWLNFFKMKEVVRESRTLYEKVKAVDEAKGLVWLEPSILNSTYCIVMKNSTVEETGITTLSQWAEWIKKNPGKMTVASNSEFYSRPDGFKGMMEFYGLEFGKDIPDANVVKMKTPLCKKAVRDDQAMCGMAFFTDGETSSYKLTILKDDKNYFPIYNPAPVIRAEVLAQYPEIKRILDEIGPSLDGMTMARLNYRVNVNGEKPDSVAKSWLKGVGLIVKKQK